ncbi:MAG TPA: hypothetical protein DCM87_09800 [Planctomycetes bacterium]|nr:hypothetical protein [Planctomycetota bacterium]
MDCMRCRSLLSDFLEASLPPRARAAVAAHVQACGACATEARRIEKTLALVRAAPREEPPPGLAAAVVARLGAEAEAIAAGERGRVASARAMRWATAIAASLLLGLAVFAALREHGWRRWSDGAESRIAAARADGDALRRELADAHRSAEAAAGEIAAALASAREQRQEHEAALKRLDDASCERERELAALKASLAASRRETERLTAAIAKLAAERAAPETRGAAPGDAAPPPAVEPAELAAAGTAAQARANVIFVINGDKLELRTRGPRDRVVAELFAVAADDANSATADLALSALENLLGGRARGGADAAPAARRNGIMGWFNERFDGAGGEDARDAAGGTPDRRRILAELEDLWRREQERSKE